ncbi:MAG: hypothetical protein AMS18_00505 [Gemmatimonas sp. SG8_17]|nr:MAG: hypothetical protein AMS18_00505 [Gemmatimonas sp. SG8_17]
MSVQAKIRDHYLPPNPEEYLRAEPPTGRVIVIAPTRAACETIELAMQLSIETVLEREHGPEIRQLAHRGEGFGIVAGTGTGKTLSIRSIAAEILQTELRVGVVNREREATPETPTWNVVIVTTGIARRWFQDNLIVPQDTLVVDEIHQTSAELELCLALGKRVGCRFIWLSATVDPSFYAEYLDSASVLETTAFDPGRAARVVVRAAEPLEFLDTKFVRKLVKGGRGAAVFLPTRAEVEQVAGELGWRWDRLNAAFYHGGEPIRAIRPFLEGTAEKPFILAMTQAGQSALNIHGLDTVIIYDACYNTVVDKGRRVLTRQYLGANEILQMAGRVHGRVPNGEVHILSDRKVDFPSLTPTPPAFQLAGDSERVALTAAALSIDLAELELPVPLDRKAYSESVQRLTARGLVKNGRLTSYGHDVEAMPVDRPWAELLVHADEDLLHCVAVCANIDSLHRMTRDESDLGGLIVPGSDHLTGYNVFAEAVEKCGFLGQVYGLPRHLFVEEVSDWAEQRGVLVKALEDTALGLASVMRTLETPLRRKLPRVTRENMLRFRDLIARIMPFELAIEHETVSGERVRLSRSSVCGGNSAVAGTVTYFADRFGIPRAAIEGTEIPFSLIQKHATASAPTVEFRSGSKRSGLFVTQTREYFGFELSRERRPLTGEFPSQLADRARDALVTSLLAGATSHPDQQRLSRTLGRLDEYWRRSGGILESARPGGAQRHLREQVQKVRSWDEFLHTALELDMESTVPLSRRSELDKLPTSVRLLGDQVPLRYDFEAGVPIVRIRLREGQARRLRARDLPGLDRPVRFSVYHGKREVVRASSLDELQQLVGELTDRRRHRPRRRSRGH